MIDYSSLERDDKRYLWHPFTQQQDWEAEPQLVITEAQGCYLIDAEGRRYLDGVSSLWANLHGHRHPMIDAAIKQQLEKVAHTTMLGLTHPSAIQLGKRLVDLAPGGLSRVFYSDTGAAAMEIALKMAFQYWQQIDPPQSQRTAFLSIQNAYHGDTVGAMSVGGIDIYRHAYAPLFFPTLVANAHAPCTCGNQPTCSSCNVPCLDMLEHGISQHADKLVAVLIEPLFQGAGGIHVYPKGYTRAVWEMAKRHGLLFIVDEVATGFGRTGKMFACEHEGIEPDIMGLGKGISGGYLPLAATLATEEIYQAFVGPGRTFYHGHTYTGNPLACAAALANLDIFEQERTLEKLQPRIEQLRLGLERLHALPMVADIRQCGLVAGIELADIGISDRKGRDGVNPIGANLKASVRVEHTGEASSPLHDGMVPIDAPSCRGELPSVPNNRSLKFAPIGVNPLSTHLGRPVDDDLVTSQPLQHPSPFPPEKKVGVRVIKEARKRGVILRPLSDVIVLMPPLAISEQELTLLLDVVQEAIMAVAEDLGDE